jgi:predicted transcriptional regulator
MSRPIGAITKVRRQLETGEELESLSACVLALELLHVGKPISELAQCLGCSRDELIEVLSGETRFLRQEEKLQQARELVKRVQQEGSCKR